MNFQNQINNFKGNKMLRTRSISTIASIALLGSLGFSGCGNSNDKSAAATSAATATLVNTTATPAVASTPLSSVASESKIASAVVTGKVSMVQKSSPSRSLKAVDNQSSVIAYNLNDGTKYETLTDSYGNYTLGGLTEGKYQIIASSTATTQRSVRQVEIKRATRQVVDIVLQAAGNIEGYVYGVEPGTIVAVLGTSYLATVNENGYFQLSNVPVGELSISVYGGYYSQNVTVIAGDTVEVMIDTNAAAGNIVDYIDISSAESTLALRHMGIPVHLNQQFTFEELQNMIHIKDASGQDVAITINSEQYEQYMKYKEYYPEGYTFTINYFTVQTTELVPAGDYTLSISDMDKVLYSETFTTKDFAALFMEGNSEHGGFYEPKLGMAFAKTLPDIIDVADITILDENNITVTNLKATKVAEENVLMLDGDFEIGQSYSVVLSGALADISDGVIYVSNDMLQDNIVYKGVAIESLYPYDGQTNVHPDDEVRFYITQAEGLNLASVAVKIGNNTYTIANGGLETEESYSWSDETRYFKVKGTKLPYGSTVSVDVTAQDVNGRSLAQSTTFTTITPKTVGIYPEARDIYDNLGNSYDGYIQAYFNVPIDEKSGTIELYDVDNDSVVDVKLADRFDYLRNTNAIESNQRSSYMLGVNPKELKENTHYRINVKGFKTEDGTTLLDESSDFTTPAKSFLHASIANASYVRAENLNNSITFDFFGKLNEDEKSAIEQDLTITSFDEVLQIDEAHPELLTVWEETQYGERLYLAFTIDPAKSYEIAFSSEEAKALGIPGSKLTFMTLGAYSDTPNTYSVIDYAYLEPNLQNYDYDLSSSVNSAYGYARVNIPMFVKTYDMNSDSSWPIEDECNQYRYQDAPDMSTWFSEGLVVDNVYAETYTEDRHIDDVCDESGCHHTHEITCIVSYSASLHLDEVDYNRSYEFTLNVPQENIPANVNVTNTTQIFGLQTPAVNDYMISADGYYGDMAKVFIDFAAPILESDLAKIDFSTLPLEVSDGNVTNYQIFHYGEDKYINHLEYSVKSSQYSLMKYNVMASELTPFNVVTKENSAIKVNINESGVMHTQADLVPVQINHIEAVQANQIRLDLNKPVDMQSVVTYDDNGTITNIAFEVLDENNSSLEIADISQQDYETTVYRYSRNYEGGNYEDSGYMYNNEGEWDYFYRYVDYVIPAGLTFTLASDLNMSSSYILVKKDDAVVVAKNSTQKLNFTAQDVVIPFIIYGAKVANDLKTITITLNKVAQELMMIEQDIAPIAVRDESQNRLSTSSIEVNGTTITLTLTNELDPFKMYTLSKEGSVLSSDLNQELNLNDMLVELPLTTGTIKLAGSNVIKIVLNRAINPEDVVSYDMEGNIAALGLSVVDEANNTLQIAAVNVESVEKEIYHYSNSYDEYIDGEWVSGEYGYWYVPEYGYSTWIYRYTDYVTENSISLVMLEDLDLRASFKVMQNSESTLLSDIVIPNMMVEIPFVAYRAQVSPSFDTINLSLNRELNLDTVYPYDGMNTDYNLRVKNSSGNTIYIGSVNQDGLDLNITFNELLDPFDSYVVVFEDNDYVGRIKSVDDEVLEFGEFNVTTPFVAIEPKSYEPQSVSVSLNRDVNLSSVAIYDENNTIADVAFEIMDEQNVSVAIKDVRFENSMDAVYHYSADFYEYVNGNYIYGDYGYYFVPELGYETYMYRYEDEAAKPAQLSFVTVDDLNLSKSYRLMKKDGYMVIDIEGKQELLFDEANITLPSAYGEPEELILDINTTIARDGNSSIYTFSVEAGMTYNVYTEINGTNYEQYSDPYYRVHVGPENATYDNRAQYINQASLITFTPSDDLNVSIDIAWQDLVDSTEDNITIKVVKAAKDIQW